MEESIAWLIAELSLCKSADSFENLRLIPVDATDPPPVAELSKSKKSFLAQLPREGCLVTSIRCNQEGFS